MIIITYETRGWKPDATVIIPGNITGNDISKKTFFKIELNSAVMIVLNSVLCILCLPGASVLEFPQFIGSGHTPTVTQKYCSRIVLSIKSLLVIKRVFGFSPFIWTGMEIIFAHFINILAELIILAVVKTRLGTCLSPGKKTARLIRCRCAQIGRCPHHAQAQVNRLRYGQ